MVSASRLLRLAWISPSISRLFSSPTRSIHYTQLFAATAPLSNAIVAYLEMDKGSITFTETTDDPLLQRAAQKTWNWCANFVVPYNLCPWAQGSVQAQNAIRIYMIDGIDKFEQAVEIAATKFRQEIENCLLDPNTAIAFCVLVSKDDGVWEFGSFYQWFVDIEEDWLDQAEYDPNHVGNYITLAPFHPDWQFATDDKDDPLQIEKQSPYPTITIVSTAVIDKAGEEATAKIANHNVRILQSKTLAEWKALYHQAVVS